LTDGLECVRRYREFENLFIANNDGPSSSKDNEGSGDSEGQKPLVIIGMSANSNDTLLKEILDVGMNAFIAKPFSIEQLERVVACKTKQSSKELPPQESRDELSVKSTRTDYENEQPKLNATTFSGSQAQAQGQGQGQAQSTATSRPTEVVLVFGGEGGLAQQMRKRPLEESPSIGSDQKTKSLHRSCSSSSSCAISSAVERLADEEIAPEATATAATKSNNTKKCEDEEPIVSFQHEVCTAVQSLHPSPRTRPTVKCDRIVKRKLIAVGGDEVQGSAKKRRRIGTKLLR
jgi:CheY-like chemotaxis protein